MPSAFLFAGVQLAVWLVRRSDAALAWWALANFIGGCGAIGVAARGHVADWISMALANALIVASLCASWAGMRRFAGRTAPTGLVLGVPGLSFVLLGWVPAIADHYAARVVVTSLMLSAVNLAIAVDLQRSQRGEGLRSRLFLVWVFGLSGLFYGWRAWVSRDVAPDSSVLVPDIITGLTLLLANMKLLAWNLGALLMANERMQAYLTHAATRDALTNVLNRAGFRDLGDRQHQRSLNARRPLSVLLMDLDRFKSVNDRFGHDAGDRALCTFTDAVRHALRPTDLLARMGGEEFSALLPEADLAAAMEAAERVRASVEALQMNAGGERFRLTVSIGVAQVELSSEPIHGAISRADVALYRAKAEGRNRVCAALPKAAATDPLSAQAIEPCTENGGP